jgi:hypothetical protein
MECSKYIIFDSGGLDVPMVFSPLLEHAQVASGIRLPILSAGFCALDSYEPFWETWGKSVSLGVSSRKHDGVLITQAIQKEMFV